MQFQPHSLNCAEAEYVKEPETACEKSVVAEKTPLALVGGFLLPALSQAVAKGRF